MSVADLINGLFEFFGSLAIWWNVVAISRDKKFSGSHNNEVRADSGRRVATSEVLPSTEV